MKRKTLITIGFVITTVLQGISYPAIALAENETTTNEQESVSSLESKQNYNSPENDSQNDSNVNTQKPSNDGSETTTTNQKEDNRSTEDAAIQPKANGDTNSDSPDSPSTAPQNGWNEDKSQWHENGQAVRSKFFYDRDSDAWYWADEDSSIACNKDVFAQPAIQTAPTGNGYVLTNNVKWLKAMTIDTMLGIISTKKTGEMTKGVYYRTISDGTKAWVYYDWVTGKMAHGECYLNYDKNHTGWHYFDPQTGAMAHDFVYLRQANKWVYYDKYTGQMLYGEHCINNGWYYMDPTTGALAKGWKKLKGKQVYYDPTSSRMFHGGAIIDGRHYFFDPYTGAKYSKQQIIDRLINFARSQIGKHPDCPGTLTANGGLICPYGPCMSFVWYAFHIADLDIFLCDGAKTGWPHHNYDWYASRGRVDLSPRPGDIVFWQFGGWANGLSASHAGIVVSVSHGRVRIVDAANNSIAERNAYNGVKGYAHPYYD